MLKHIGLLTLRQSKLRPAARAFALFGQKPPQERTQEHIAQNIESYRTNIRNKSQQGQALARSVAESVEADKHLKLQRYEVFIDKMQRLYKSELRAAQRQKKKLQVQKNAILYSLTPLKEILRMYNELTHNGFNSEAAVQTLQNLGNALRARGYKGRVMGDYSAPELDQSWRMQKLVNDLTFGLREDQFFSSHHLGQVNAGLGEIGYKNTELIPKVFEKLNTLLDERQLGISHEQLELNYTDAVYGGAKGFVPRHYVFKGFQDSEEFNEYLKILMEWENTEKGGIESSNEQLNDQAAELQESMAEIINAAVQVKELQKDFQGSIDNLRQQYFQMSEATDKHNFLIENQYIKYDLLELQELLVKGGYIEPEEANATLANEPFDQRMQRASDVFYDYVVNYSPELLSPQHQSFYQAATSSSQPQSNTDYQSESQNAISLKTLSQSLVGLAEQALSFRRDVHRRDYLNKFYEKYLMPMENQQHGNDVHGMDKVKMETVMMERGYLRAWQQFKEHSEEILPRFATLVEDDKNHLEGQLHALSALTSCRFDAQKLRGDIVSNALRLIGTQGDQLQSSSIVSGLKGLAESASLDDKAKQLSQLLASKVNSHTLTFTQHLDVLWSLSALQLYDAKAFTQSLKHINSLSFDRLDSDLKYEEYLKVLDIHNALKFEGPNTLSITNKGLLQGIQGQEMYLGIRYSEHSTMYDPFKQRVVQAISKGLTNASVDHQVIFENELYQAQTLETSFLNADRYPYKPDILMGYKGQKVGVFVLPETSTTRDTLQANGVHRFRMRILEKASENSLKAAAIAVNDVVKYDIENFQLDINQEFRFQNILDAQIKFDKHQSEQPNFSSFSEFGAKLMSKAADFIEQIPSNREVSKLDTLVQRLYQVLHVKQQNELRFEPLQKAAGNDELRFQLMKLSLLFDTLSQPSQIFIDSFAASKNFKSLLQLTLATIPVNDRAHQIQAGLDSSWLGTRLEVELPVNQASVKKSIVPEMINQRFMWVDDYFHYDDWKTKQKSVFDNFNLLVVPGNKEGNKFFFDGGAARRVPQGVFPYATHKRQLLTPPSSAAVIEMLRSKHHDDYVLFEKEPFKMMVLNELKKAETLEAIDDETSMITNLQNVKQGLKSDYSDREILNIILLNLDFTDQLIQEHLGGTKAGSQKYVERDAEKYRKFVESTYHSKDREDPYTHFYLKEARKTEKINQLIREETKLQKETEEESRINDVVEEGHERRRDLQEKIEEMLMREENRNEDINQLSASLLTHVQVKYDMRSLVKSEFVYDVDPELTSLSPEEYLAAARRRAEAKLIKAKIIYKLYQAKAELTHSEKQYLKRWVSDIKEGRNLLNLRDSMVPEHPTRLTIGDVDAKTLYALNSVSRVTFERDRHGGFSLNDLILELTHFLDEEVVNKVETEIFSEKLRSEWGLSKDFSAVETRNKEIGLVLNELEEVAWRSAGMLNERDFEHVKAMISVKRNKDYFDRQFYDNDMKSFRHFFESANTYDDRLALLERWLVRKEDEVKARVVRPSASLKKADQELFDKIDGPQKKAREQLAAKLLIADEHGNPIDKEYKDLTSLELHTLTENLCLRMYLFNYEYPMFLPQVVRAVIQHPSLLKSDNDQLELYCKMFELDWRGDHSYTNRKEFMATHPIYIDGTNIKSYGDITDDLVKDKLQRACAPYVEEAARQLLNHS